MATLVISSNTLGEDAQAGALVGTLSVAGEIAAGETFTFILDDERFQIIDGNQLVVKSGSFNFEGLEKQFTLNIQAVGSQNTPVEAAPVVISLTNVNEAPTDITLVSGGTIGDNAILGATVATLAGQDPDRGDLLTYTIVTDINGATEYDHPYLGTSGSEIVVKHDLSDASIEPMPVYVKVTDAKGLSYVKQITLTVTPVNEAPEVNAEPVEVLDGSKGGTLVAVISAIDPEDGVLTYKLSAASAQWFSLVDNNDGTWNVVVKQGVTLRSDRAAFQSLVVEVSDNAGNTTSETVFLNINENLEPEATFEFREVGRNTPAGILVGTLVAYDPEGEAVSYTLSGESAKLFSLVKNEDGTYGVLVKQGVTLDYTDEAQRSFTVKVSDGFNFSFEETFDLVFGSYTLVSVSEGAGGGTIVGKLVPTDDDGNQLSYSLSDANSSLFDLVANSSGGYDVVVRSGVTLDYENDSHHILGVNVTNNIGTVSKSFEISLRDVNVIPTATLTSITVNEGAGDHAIAGKLKAVDVEDEELTCILSAESAAWFELIDNGDGDYDIVVRDGIKLDYENPSHRVVNVVVSDGVHSLSRTLNLSLIDGVDTLIGAAKTDSLNGTAGRDIIKGLAGNDMLTGNTGNDRLYGGTGKDVLNGGGGQDVFVFDSKPNKKTNLDKVADFTVVDDSMWLENKIFTKLGKKGSETSPAQIKKSFFVVGDKAKDKDDYLIYNKKTGALSYDADGSGSQAAVQIAALSKKLGLTHKDFFVI
ncbi:hypothetical protein [Microvirga arabica]|uniref:hypothetical protein n=1 Tax=Microvirga arabica TaxID=1128671 RepID=UPI00361CC475